MIGGQRSSPMPQKASRSARLTALRSTAPPTLRLTEIPRRVADLVRAAPRRAREGVEDEEAVGVRAAVAIDAVEVPAARQPTALSTLAHRLRGRGRLRPLARRRRITSRPDRVRIRARKPWVRARLRFFGCQVRFIGSASLQERAASTAARLRFGLRPPRRSAVSFPRIAGWARSGAPATECMVERSGRRSTRRRPLDPLGRGPRRARGLASPPPPFDLWFEPLRAVSRQGATLFLSAPPSVRAWVERRYGERLLDAVDRGSRPTSDRDRLRRRGAAAPSRRPAPESLPLDRRPHLRALRHRPRQPARPRRGARRRRAPRARPTTRSSSTARPGSARPTCSARSSSTCDATTPSSQSTTRPPSGSRPSSSPPCAATGRRPSRPATASSTRC